MQTKTLIEHLPKAELHLHIEGTLEPEMMMTLAQRNTVALTYQSVAAIREAYDFSCLQDFLDIYYAGMSVLLERQDFRDLTLAYLQRVAAQNVRHVEIFFDPQAHTSRGIAFDTVAGGLLDALDTARRDFNMSSRLIMCFLRHLPEDSAFETLAQASAWKEQIIAVGLDSSEKGNPPAKFERVFSQARREGYKAVAHAGEEGPADYVREALERLKVNRIDHGNRCVDDPSLLSHIAASGVPLTLCPLSNLKLQVVENLQNYPLRPLLAAGVIATLNSDDPAYFGGYLNENYTAVNDALELSAEELTTLARNSFVASFLLDNEKRSALDHFDVVAAKLG